MASFCIKFTGEYADYDTDVAIGVLQLGEDTEYFHAPTVFWAVEQYESSWKAALRRTVEGAEISCLVVAISDPTSANFIEVWPIYREDDTVYLQNRFLFLDHLDGMFNTDAPWASIGARRTVNEDGNNISEWALPLHSLREFLVTLR